MKNARKVIATALAIIAALGVLGGCGSKPQENTTPSELPENDPATEAVPVEGGDLTVGIAQDLDNILDPHNMVTAGTREVLFNIFEGLVKPDSKGNFVPAVAESVEHSEAGDVYTFTLRDGVKFHDGSDVTADDVIYSLSRAAGLNDGKVMIEGLDLIDSITSEDGKVITVTLKEPNTEILALFTAGIIPEGSDPADATIGTGPFKLVSRTPMESIVIEKNSEYWGTPAHVDTVTYKIIDNANTLVMSLKSGELDLVAHLTSAQVKELGDDFNVLEGTMNLVQAVYLNHEFEPFSDPKVRQALSYAVDPQMVMDFLADGRGVALGSSMYPAFSKYYVDLADTYSYDPEKAKALLAEAGYPDGFEFDCTVPSNYQPHIDSAEVIAEQLKEVGVTLNIKLVDWDTWVSDTYVGRNYEATVVGVDASVLTARAMLGRFYSKAGDNFTNYNNEEYDKVFEEAIKTSDDEKQVELYKELQTILAEDAANVYVQDMCDLVALGNGVEGYEFYPLYVMDMSLVYFTEQ